MGVQPRVKHWVAIATFSAGVLSGCKAENPSAAVVDPCLRRVDAAALAIDVDDTTEFLDSAMGICDTLSAFEAAFARHPGVLGFSTLEVVARRCLNSTDIRATTASMCEQAPVIALTGLPSYTAAHETDTYTGVALDGRAVELGANSGVEFIRGIPVDLVEAANLAAQKDCGALAEMSRRWRAEAELNDSESASVLAHATEVIADHIECGIS